MITIHEPAAVEQRLAQLELTHALLRDALVQANMFRARLTSHHGFLYRCAVLSCETVAALRDALIPRGWEKMDEGHYDRVFNPRLNCCIAVASGDEGTGNKGLIPSNRSPKGPRTVKAVQDNQTIDLFPETLEQLEGLPIDTWLLLHCRKENEIRLELSRPGKFDATGRYVISWTERILLAAIPLDGNDDRPIVMPDTPDVDITIVRKKA